MEAKKNYIKPEILVEEWKVYKETYNSRYGHRIYKVSNFGRVKLNGEFVDFSNQTGYYAIARFYIHRAVAELFIPNPEHKPCVDHIDTNKHNNMLWNLRWVTHKENSNNPLTQKHISENNGMKRPEVSKKVSESLKGKSLRDETKQKMSEVQKIVHNRPETRQKHRETMLGRICINKNNTEKRIKPDQLSLFLNKGWDLGKK